MSVPMPMPMHGIHRNVALRHCCARISSPCQCLDHRASMVECHLMLACSSMASSGLDSFVPCNINSSYRYRYCNIHGSVLTRACRRVGRDTLSLLLLQFTFNFHTSSLIYYPVTSYYLLLQYLLLLSSTRQMASFHVQL